MKLTKQHLRAILPQAKPENIEYFIDDLNKFSWLIKFTDPIELAAFIAQIAKETNELLWWEELALGNTEKGDGVLFKGRGYIQLTGRFNYVGFTQWYNHKFAHIEDFTLTPQRIAKEHELCMLVTIFFWVTKGLRNPKIYTDCTKTTKRVNGGQNGLKDRQKYFNLAKTILVPDEKDNMALLNNDSLQQSPEKPANS
jgi:putative chitinase